MTGRDDIILEFLAESGAAHNKKGIEINLEENADRISYSTIQRRLPKLEEAGLVEQVREEGAWYQITDEGASYLEGEIDLSNMDDPVED